MSDPVLRSQNCCCVTAICTDAAASIWPPAISPAVLVCFECILLIYKEPLYTFGSPAPKLTAGGSRPGPEFELSKSHETPEARDLNSLA